MYLHASIISAVQVLTGQIDAEILVGLSAEELARCGWTNFTVSVDGPTLRRVSLFNVDGSSLYFTKSLVSRLHLMFHNVPLASDDRRQENDKIRDYKKAECERGLKNLASTDMVSEAIQAI